MSPWDWSFAAALVTTGVAVLLPWMLSVHGRLAVALTKLDELEKRVRQITEHLEGLSVQEYRRQLEWSRLENRLQGLEARITDGDLAQ